MRESNNSEISKTMETQTHNTNTLPWSSATNWTVSHGDLDTAITFESSSDYATDSETVGSTWKSPLVLRSPSPDSGPCEIKICFTQKHEIRQIYVRSTARVYEIYYTPPLWGGDKYLCTVRCGAAARDEKLLYAIATENAAPAYLKGSSDELAEEKSTGEGDIGTNEDDWVEVKVPDSSLLENGINSLPNKTNDYKGRSIQVFYEATAEITDADPCIALTLRLLSLQKQGCVHVDEIYGFADPVESSDAENQTVQVGNSTGSSLMAMLVPTLLQLSKSGVSQKLDKHALDTIEEHKKPEIGSRATDATDAVNEIPQDTKFSIAEHQEMKLQEVNEATAEPDKFQCPTQVSGRDRKDDYADKNDFLCGQVERVLEQLVSRVSRIEDLCLRFEENMLKPMNSMEARLQRVEHQLELLAKNAQPSGLQTGTRFSAPAFSCTESNSSSYYNDGTDYPPCGASGLEQKDFPSEKLATDNTSVSANAPQFLPSLVVTAPEFSCEDEVNNDVLEPSKDSLLEQPKPSLSIDDALAAALAGFLSMSTPQPLKLTETPTFTSYEFSNEEIGNNKPSTYTHTLTVKAPEFTSDDDGNDVSSEYTQAVPATAPESVSENCNDGKVLPPIIENENLEVPSNSCETDENECIHGFASTSKFAVSTQCAEGRIRNYEEVSFDGHLYEGVNGCCCPPPQVKIDLAETNDALITEETCGREASYGVTNVTICERSNGQDPLCQTQDSINISLENAAASRGCVAGDGSHGETLQNVFKSASASSVVDFEIPILEVEFSSSEISSTDSPLEVLLKGVAESNIEPPCVQKSSDDPVIGEQDNLIFVEDGEHMGPSTSNHLSVDLDSYDVSSVSSILDGILRDPLTCSNHCNQEMIASLI
ncbi:unnamed protein product [Ilex paraguariensis]|uniref:Uncharacterized protein n=1 Tax=Ilex paraguariensis TaxID=185542 RepID=A0ABC8TE15_9AQUA